MILTERGIKARYDFFKMPSVGKIRKSRGTEVIVPPETPFSEIIDCIDSLGSDEHIWFAKDIIPQEWKLRAKKKNQNEYMNHAPYFRIEVHRGKPTAVIKQAFYDSGKPYANYAWSGTDGILRFFKPVDIAKAHLLYEDLKLIDEPMNVDGSKREYCCTVSSRDIKTHKMKEESTEYDVTLINIPVIEECERWGLDPLVAWRDILSNHYCKYKSNNDFTHYKTVSFDPHDMAALFAIMDNNNINMLFDIFPRLNEGGARFFTIARDAILVYDERNHRNRNIRYAELGILLHYKMKEDKPRSVFDFST